MDLSQYSDDQLRQIAGIGNPAPAADLSQYSDEDLAKAAGVQLKSQPGFIDRVAGDLTNRANEGADAIVAYKAGGQGLAQTGLQVAGKMGAGALNDVVSEGINSLTPDAVKQGLASGAQTAANVIDNNSIGRKVGDMLLSGRDAYSDFARNNPNAARSLEAAGNIAAVLPMAKTITSAGQTVGDVGNGLKSAADFSIANDVGKNLPGILGDTRSGSIKPSAITRDMVKNAASNAYKFADQAGAEIQPQLTNKAISFVESGLQEPFFGGRVLTSEQKSVNDALSEFLPAKGQAATLRDFQALDSNLGDKASMAYIAGDTNKARIIGDVQSKIRTLLQPENLSPGDVTGSTEGIDALTNHAIPLWATQAKMADIEKIIDRANMMDNPSTAIKTGLRNLSLNEGKMAQYPAEVQKLIIKGAQTGKTDDLLGIFGSRLNAIAGQAVGGVPGAIMSNASSMAARDARTALKNNQADAILNGLVENVRPSIEKYVNGIPQITTSPAPLPEPIKLLPAPAKELLVDNSGNVRPQTPYEQFTADNTRQNYQGLGLTPDILSLQAKQNAQKLLQKYGQSEVGQFLSRNQNIPLNGVFEIPQTKYSQAQVDSLMRNSDWDKLTRLQQQKISLDIERAWQQHQTPLAEMILKAQMRAADLASAKGEVVSDTVLGNAFKQAGKIKK